MKKLFLVITFMFLCTLLGCTPIAANESSVIEGGIHDLSGSTATLEPTYTPTLIPTATRTLTPMPTPTPTHIPCSYEEHPYETGGDYSEDLILVEDRLSVVLYIKRYEEGSFPYPISKSTVITVVSGDNDRCIVEKVEELSKIGGYYFVWRTSTLGWIKDLPGDTPYLVYNSDEYPNIICPETSLVKGDDGIFYPRMCALSPKERPVTGEVFVFDDFAQLFRFLGKQSSPIIDWSADLLIGENCSSITTKVDLQELGLDPPGAYGTTVLLILTNAETVKHIYILGDSLPEDRNLYEQNFLFRGFCSTSVLRGLVEKYPDDMITDLTLTATPTP